MNALEGVRKYINKKITNTIAGASFNREAFDEAHACPLKLQQNEHDDSDPAYNTDEEWTTLTKVKGGPRAHDQINMTDEFLVRESPSIFGQMRIQITAAALEKTCEVAGVSKEYANMALKYVATEAAHDIGWVTNCKTVMDAVLAVKNRFPMLEDMEKAYKQGRKESKAEQKATLRKMEDVAWIGGEGIQEGVALHKGKRIIVGMEEGDEDEEYDGDTEVETEHDKFLGQE